MDGAATKKRVSNVDIFFLDTRTFRQQHDMADVRSPGRSMVGERQRKWLMDEMKASDATFTFIVSPVNFTIPHIGGTTSATQVDEGKDEAWTFFIEERDQLIALWNELGKPVFVITGDLHNSFVIKISDNVLEFAGGPNNAGQHPLTSEGNRQPNGLFEYAGREVEICWSSFALPDTPNHLRNRVIYCIAQINNVWRNPKGGRQDALGCLSQTAGGGAVLRRVDGGLALRGVDFGGQIVNGGRILCKLKVPFRLTPIAAAPRSLPRCVPKLERPLSGAWQGT